MISNPYLHKAAKFLMSQAQDREIVNGEIVISADGPENARLLNRALELIEVQQAFNKRRAKPVIKQITPPIEQAKEHMLTQIRLASPEVEMIVFPCSPRDAEDYHAALRSAEVKRELSSRDFKATVQVVEGPEPKPKNPTILIATLDDVASGKLDEYM